MDKEIFEMTDEELAVEGIRVRIRAKKEELAKYDYIGVKIAMGVAAKEDYAEQIAYTENLRADINELEKELD